MNAATLSRLWAKFEKAGCNLADYPKMPGAYFSHAHISTKITQLKEERERRREKTNERGGVA